MRPNEPIALFDMDSSLVDYEARLRERLHELMSPMEVEWFKAHEPDLLHDPPPWLKARERRRLATVHPKLAGVAPARQSPDA
jgi:phosphoserine phosphatase